MFSILQLSPVTYAAFGVLCVVVYLYIRQRTEYNRSLAGEPTLQETQPTTQSQRPFGYLGVQTPTFSAQELEQRKPAKEIDQSTLNPRSFQHLPEFNSPRGIPSSFGSKPQQQQQQQGFEPADKVFGGFRKSVQYEPITKSEEPVPSSSGFVQAGRSQPPSSFYAQSEFPSRTFPQEVPQQYVASPVETKMPETTGHRRSSISEMKEEGFIAPRKQSIGEQGSVPIDKYGSEFDLDREYKVFSQEFKQKEGKGFHDVKKYESPNRFGRGSHSHFDRVGHSPDSPFKFFESKADKDSQKRLKSTEQEVTSSKGKKSAGDLKEEDSTPVPRGRGRESVQPDITAKSSKIASKIEKRQKSGQIFMNVGSDDDEDQMLIEKEKKQGILHKRAGIDSGSIDEIEKQSLRGKFFKDNNQQAKYRTQEDRKSSLDQGSLSPSRMNESQGSSKRRSVADISYLSEFGANTSMQRYIEKKASQAQSEKPERFSVAPTTQKYVNPLVPAKDTRHSFPQSQETKKLEVPKPAFTSLIQPSQKALGQTSSPGLGAQKRPAPGGFLLTNEPKSPNKDIFSKKKEIEEEKPVEKKIGGSLFTQSEKIAEEKPVVASILPKAETKPLESVKMSDFLKGSAIKPVEAGSLFQQKPAETKTETLVKAPEQKEEESKKEETKETTTTPSVSNGFDLFKTVRAGTTLPFKPEEKKPTEENGLKQVKKESEEEKKPSPTTAEPEKKALFFNAGALGKKTEEEPKKEQEPAKSEPTKPMFGGASAGLFGITTPSLAKTTSEEESKKKTENTTAPATTGFLGGFKPVSSPVASQTPLFGGATSSFLKREDSKNSGTGLFNTNNNKTSNDEKVTQETTKPSFGFIQKKDSEPAAEANKTENGSSSPQKPALGGGLFSNLPKTEGTSLFGGTKAAGGEGLFSNIKKDAAPTGGLFANMNKQEGGMFATFGKNAEQK